MDSSSDSQVREGGKPLYAPVEIQQLRRARRAGLLIVAGSILLFCIIATVGILLGMVRLIGWTALLGVAGCLVGLRRLLERGPGERELSPGAVRFDSDTVVVNVEGQAAQLRRGDIVGGWIEQSAKGHIAVWSFRGGEILAVERPTEVEAMQLLRRAGPELDKMAVRMTTHRESVAGRMLAACVAALAGTLSVPVTFVAVGAIAVSVQMRSASSLLVWVIPSALLIGLTVWMSKKIQPAWVQIGTDGVLIRTGSTTSFVRHADVVRVEHATDEVFEAVRIILVDGEAIVIPVSTSAAAAVIVDRMTAAKDAGSGTTKALLAEKLDRAGRSVDEWTRDLANLLQVTDYRMGLEVEQLMQLVEDPELSPARRVAAALAAKPSTDDPVQQRIRLAAAQCAEPRLRIALDDAATGSVDHDLLAELSNSSTSSEAATK